MLDRVREATHRALSICCRQLLYLLCKPLRPVFSKAKRPQVRGLMCSASNNMRVHDRDVPAALDIRRCAVGPGPRTTLPKPNPNPNPGQDWAYVRDKALWRTWRQPVAGYSW
ncbi:hypothetical protein QJQ45_001172 [Haematococcus lacustris]|nr:hypothetical protein QJQ45_001172 [Haematococcus lacustris]